MMIHFGQLYHDGSWSQSNFHFSYTHLSSMRHLISLASSICLKHFNLQGETDYDLSFETDFRLYKYSQKIYYYKYVSGFTT